ncbi:MAG: helix-turn-helix domain-containing protein [Segniliparus sp.]|uniref:helix-turn-helix domain-containing protein n=1 Tax=Segniliparus sp. TaxID=2804064 RepID=UPI003F3EB9A5
MNRPIKGLDISALSEARKRQGVSRHDLARRAAVSKTTIGAWEIGARSPNIESLAKVAQALGLRMDDLIKVPEAERTLADLRRLAGLSQTRLAWLTGTTAAAIAGLERGEISLTEEKAQALAPAIDASAEDIKAAWQRSHDRPLGEPA